MINVIIYKWNTKKQQSVRWRIKQNLKIKSKNVG